MKRVIIVIGLTILLLAGLVLTGCNRIEIGTDSGPLVTREYDYTGFTVVEVGYAFELVITPSDTYSVIIRASEGAFDRIKVTKKGRRQEIGADTPFFHFFRSPTVTITMPELRGLHLSGASEGNVTGFKTSGDFDLSLSGASELYMELETGDFEGELSGASEVTGSLVAASCDFNLSGASDTELTGSGGNIKIDGSGASQVDLSDFTVNNAYVELSGASDTKLTVNGRLDVDLSGSSFLEYGGNPTLGDIDLSGGSEIEKIN